MRFKIIFTFILFLTAQASSQLCAQQLNIAVASNFINVMQELERAFILSKKLNPQSVRVSYASSGKLYAQIKQGAPFDVFLSADSDKPQRLIADNLTAGTQPYPYAVGRLVLWRSNNNRQILQTPVTQRTLLNGEYNKLAMANPKLAPYGLAALQVLEKLKLERKTKADWVMGENVSQAYQFVATGNAELGFVALSQVKASKQAEEAYWLVPASMHEQIAQHAVTLKKANNNPLAQAFMLFLSSQTSKTIIESHGYETD
ncbi:molybdate ABC transporter substrate-binding protein [Catenovulum sediminis]|uniref:molybdate ABC transporter substrate-binding protein n=1 Tax=Catenovulum sediminis TaxID=1740262 RepID=UPI00117CB4B0|nr:molybdate ABC transporter substrate-binding protein [Catenovulum sediminis]